MGRYNVEPHDHSKHYSTSNIKLAFFLNLIFTIVEIIGGFLTNSVAVLSDALHDLGDTFSLGLSWYFQKKSQRSRDEKYSYGYGRFSVFGAMVSAIVLVIGSVVIIMESIPRLMNPVQPETSGMIWLALFGVAMNGLAFLRLRKGSSLNERVISLHMLEDVLGWIAVLIGGIVMHFENIPILDPILSLCIAAWMAINAFRNVMKANRILLQGTPEHIQVDKITAEVERLSGVVSAHDCHVWTMDGSYLILTIDVVVAADMRLAEQESIKVMIWDVLKKYRIDHATIEFDSKENIYNHTDQT